MCSARRFAAATAVAAGLALAAGMGAAAAAAPVPARQSIVLAPAFGEAARSERARGVFFSATVAVTAGAAEVLLASSPDGAGELCTDDQARLVFRRAGVPDQEWTHLFAVGAGGIVCLPPQRLRLEAGAGAYEVVVTLSDRFPFTYGSRPYYLIVEQAATATVRAAVQERTSTVASAPVVSVEPSSTGVPAPTRGATPAPAETAVLPMSVPVPTPIAVPAPAATPAQASPGGAGRHEQPGAPSWFVPALLTTAAVLVALLAAALLGGRRTRRGPPPLAGIVDLADRETGETRTALLQGFPGGAAVVRGPLGLVAPGGPEAEREIARITPGPGGPLLRAGAPDASEPVPLREGEALRLAGAVELRFRGSVPGRRPITTGGRQ